MPKARKTKHKSDETEGDEAPAKGRPNRSRPMWSGAISFGLVNIPVRLHPGIRAKDVRFHLLHEKDKARLQEKLFCPVDQEEVPRSEAVKGYEIGKDQHVIVSQEEIASLAPKASRTIDLVNVVDLKEIDPIYFNRPFYLLPDEQGAKAYYLLVEALRSSGKAAIARFVMRNKEYIGVIRPVKKALCLDTLHFAEEMVSVDDLDMPSSNVNLRDAEIKMALQLLEGLEGKFKPEDLHDDYRKAMLKLVQRKAAGQEIALAPQAEEEEPQVIDLMEALKKSVAQVQRHKGRKVA